MGWSRHILTAGAIIVFAIRAGAAEWVTNHTPTERRHPVVNLIHPGTPLDHRPSDAVGG
jgi:hypothetical protein